MITFDADRTIWEQVYELLRARIETGGYAERQAIPSINRLLQEIPVAEATLQKALNRLKTERFLRGVHGKGIFVRPRDEWTPPGE